MSTQKKLKIFMIMPFQDELTKIYQEYIKKPLKEKGYDITGADDFFRSSSILDDVIHSIRVSDIIIADLTDRNPNVFYELGFAHAREKYVIQICRAEQDIPFDLRQIRTIIYSNDPIGYNRLQDDLIKYILTYEIEDAVNKLIEFFKKSNSYYDSGRNAELIIENESKLKPKQIIEIAEATINNRQIYESDKALAVLEPFFRKYLDIIPIYIIRQLEDYGYHL